MSTSVNLSTLSAEDRRQLKILYLARFAPNDVEDKIAPVDTKHGIFSTYHYDLFHELCKLDLDVTPSRSVDHLIAQNRRYNYVFSVLNRASYRNSESLVSSVCEYLGLAYLGAPPHVRSLAEDKHLAKTLFRACGIPTPEWMVQRHKNISQPSIEFEGPYFVKPRFGAASELISESSIQERKAGAIEQVRWLHEQGEDALVEQYVSGENVSLGVLQAERPILLPCTIDNSDLAGGVVTYGQKRMVDGGFQRSLFEHNPTILKMQEICNRILVNASPMDYFRADFRVCKKTNTVSCLEFNICCNLGRHASIAIASKMIGISYSALLEHILSVSLRRQNILRN
ncbi:ATP-grasp domain-containing protein [uncultured Roseobacter sp.]|uniref:ATP-grasp domain-containing protein n=1 Tax=uncultured Roseobacter sp. TaxID=114847 RepID=UPI00260B4B6A|nr:ATP-grasp domain-containing protein [uncultured Roseobacter sp.]